MRPLNFRPENSPSPPQAHRAHRAHATPWPIALIAASCLAACAGPTPTPGAPADPGAPRPGDASSPSAVEASSPPAPTLDDHAPRELPGLHNVVAYADGVYSGSVPHGPAGFDTLAALGVATVISVDGAEPEADAARARGIRYIHLPVGYHGFDRPRRLQLARALRDARRAGPVYVHCHHGKHRSAAAAGAAAVALSWMSPDEAVARMHVSGTAPGYTGLFRVVRDAAPIDAQDLDAVPADFPERARPSGFVQGMVDADEAFEHLRLIERHAWRTPASHPDLVPAAEAGRLSNLLRLMADSPRARAEGEAFTRQLLDDAATAAALEAQLAADAPRNAPTLSAALARLAASCKDCHVRTRDRLSP